MLFPKCSLAYQRMSWEALKKSINGLINKVNVSNIVNIIQELLQENIVRGRWLVAQTRDQRYSLHWQSKEPPCVCLTWPFIVRQGSAGSFGVAGSGSVAHLHSRLCGCCFHHQLQIPCDWRADPQASHPHVQEELPPKPQGTACMTAVEECSLFNTRMFFILNELSLIKNPSVFVLQQQCLTASKFVAHLINQNVVRPVSSL